jgi:hypothetical protein
MTLPQGERIERPADSDPSWYADALGEERRVRVGDVPITVDTVQGGSVRAALLGPGRLVVLSH